MNNWTNHLPVDGIAPFQFQRISCVYGLIARSDLVRERSCFILRQIVPDRIAKVTMDVKEKPHAVIEFLLLEGCTGNGIFMRLQNVFGPDAYSRSSVFHWIQEVRRGNEELRNEGRPGRPTRHEADASIR
jgi:hypothetical protein